MPRKPIPPTFVYLLHFSAPIGSEKHTARHYIGYARTPETLKARLAHHAMGTSGVRLMEVVKERGVEWQLARLWEGGDHTLERRLKDWCNSSRLCPCCMGEAAYERAHFDNPTWKDSRALEVVRDAGSHDLSIEPGSAKAVELRGPEPALNADATGKDSKHKKDIQRRIEVKSPELEMDFDLSL